MGLTEGGKPRKCPVPGMVPKVPRGRDDPHGGTHMQRETRGQEM